MEAIIDSKKRSLVEISSWKKREDSRIRDSRVKQSFLKDEIFEAGIEEMQYNNISIRIYNRERMLVELMRFRSKIPFDYYKEIIQNYRRITEEMDFGLVEDYAYMFHKGEIIMNQIQMEVLWYKSLPQKTVAFHVSHDLAVRLWKGLIFPWSLGWLFSDRLLSWM